MWKLPVTKVFANSSDQLLRCQFPQGLNDSSLAVHPMWLNTVKPYDDACPALLLALPVMRVDLSTHCLRDVPRGIVPNRQPFLAFSGQMLTTPARNGVVISETGPPSPKRNQIIVAIKVKKNLRRGLATLLMRSKIRATTVISQSSFDVRLVTHI